MELLIVNNTSPFVNDIVRIVKELGISFKCKLYSEIMIEELSSYRRKKTERPSILFSTTGSAGGRRARTEDGHSS